MEDREHEHIQGEEWIQLHDFPGYSVSNKGRVRNDEAWRIMAVSTNQSGLAYVGMTIKGVQKQRSLALLVAEAFLQGEKPASHYDTPINLNGDRRDCSVENLAWRPRWFAVKYHKQLRGPSPRGFTNPIYCYDDDETRSIREFAITYGFLEDDIINCAYNGSLIFPQGFRIEFAE